MFEQQNSMGIMCTPQEDHSLRGTLTQVASSWQKKPSSVGIPGCVFCFMILQTVYACLRIASTLHQQTLTLSRFLWFQAVRPTSQHAERYGAQSTANGWSKKLVMHACMQERLYMRDHIDVSCVYTHKHTHTHNVGSIQRLRGFSRWICACCCAIYNLCINACTHVLKKML